LFQLLSLSLFGTFRCLPLCSGKWTFTVVVVGVYCVRAEFSAQAIEIFMGNKRILSLSLNYTVIDAWMGVGDKIN